MAREPSKAHKKVLVEKLTEPRHRYVAKPATAGKLVTVVLKSRGGKTVAVPPAAAKVLKETEELREQVSKNW